MNAWLKCSLEPGMLPGEYAVEMDTLEAGRISLFAPEDKVNTERQLMRVEILEGNSGVGFFVRLPARPFEISAQAVKVSHISVVLE